LDVNKARSAAFSFDADVDRAGAHAETRRFEAIDTIGKQGIERDRCAVGSDR
jgi:hypothetical protein